MATNVNVYVPNVGELEALKAILQTKGLTLGLYKNQVIPDGNTVIGTLTEMAGGGTYAQKALTKDIVEDAAAASKWYVSTNALGKAEGAYSNAVLSWAFNSVDAALAQTVYGIFAYCWVLPFDAGKKEIKVGDTVTGGTSGATGIVTGVCVQTGTWAAGTAAGYLDIMTKTSTWQNNEDIILAGKIVDVALGANGGANYANGDILSITQANASGGVGIVTANSGGAVTGVGLLDGGKAYTTANGLATSKITGSGDNALTANITAVAEVVVAQTNTGTNGDAYQKLMTIWAFAAGVLVDTDGQTVTFDMRLALASGT